MLSSSYASGLPNKNQAVRWGRELSIRAGSAGERVCGEERVTDGRAGSVCGGLGCTKNAKGKESHVDPSGHGRTDDFPTGSNVYWFQRKVSTGVTSKMEARMLTLGRSNYTHN